MQYIRFCFSAPAELLEDDSRYFRREASRRINQRSVDFHAHYAYPSFFFISELSPDECCGGVIVRDGTFVANQLVRYLEYLQLLTDGVSRTRSPSRVCVGCCALQTSTTSFRTMTMFTRNSDLTR